MKKAVIFDLDGTLLDSIASIKYCGDQTFERFGFGPFPISEYKYLIGDGAANLVKRGLIKAGDSELKYFDEAYALYREIFAKDCMYEVKPFDGICELLDELKKSGVKISVLSNKPHLETIRVIETLFGKDVFDVVMGQQEGVAIKPSPEGVFNILDKLGLNKDEVLYVGDTCTDMKTGKGAGLFTIGVLWGFRDRKELEDNAADAIIEHPSEILNYL